MPVPHNATYTSSVSDGTEQEQQAAHNHILNAAENCQIKKQKKTPRKT
jgi:hypothetical protein